MLFRTPALAVIAALFCALGPASPAHAARDTCFGRAATITGTRGDDVLRGTHGNDVIVGGSGDDRIFGRGGNDRICAGVGEDVVKAGRGRDRVLGGLSDDVIRGGRGRDFLDGGDQDDVLHGNAGNDRLDLGGIGREAEYAYGGLGRDVIVAADRGAFAYLYGNKGKDRLFGRGITDILEGGPGDDRIEGGMASFESSASPVTVDLRTGRASGDGTDELVEVAGVVGSAHDDSIIGSRRGEWIVGEEGADELFGGGGNDNVFGGMGEDVVWGNRGHDVLWDASDDCDIGRGCYSDDAADEFDGGPGRDRLSYSGFHTGVTADLEGAGHGGDTITGVEDLTGSSHDDVLRGNEGQNDVEGGRGSDRIEGRGSDDVLDGDQGHDTIDGGDGTDECRGEIEISCEE